MSNTLIQNARLSGLALLGTIVIGIVTRDIVPALANNIVSITFMSCHLVALLAIGLYLAIHGVRHNPTS